MKRKLGSDEKKQIGEQVRRKLESNLVENSKAHNSNLIDTPQRLAAAISVTPNIIYRAHSGDFSLRTLMRIEDALGVSFADNMLTDSESSNASAHRSSNISGGTLVRFGGYTEEGIAPYLGKFLAFSRGVTYPGNFLGSIFDIYWDEDFGGARFKEHKRFVGTDGRTRDHSQSGTLHMSSVIKNIHLLTSVGGALRLITLTGIQLDPEPVMYGAILTQVDEPGRYVPSKSTIHFRKVSEEKWEWAQGLMGPITPEHESYASIAADLDQAERAIYTR